MAVTDEFKQDVLEVLDEYTAQLENQSGVNATPIMPIANVDETVSMPAVKFDSDPRINSRAHPQGYYQIPVSDFYARIDALAGNVQDATDDLNDLKERTDQARLDTIEATEQAQAATDEASNVNATLIGMTVTITDRNGVSRQTKIGFDILTALAEIIRYFCKYDTLKGIRWSFIPFAFSFFAYTAHWWTDTEGSLAAAVEEMRAGYDQLMIPVINNIPVLVVVLVLTIPVAVLAMLLAERSLKKQL